MDLNRIEALRELFEEESAAKALFRWAIERQNDASQTSIDRLVQKAGVDRRKAIELARRLEELGFAKFITGRRGNPSRIIWKPSLKGVGRAAAGQAAAVELVEAQFAGKAADLADNEDELPEGSEALTIAEAKRRLAASLGVTPEAIEITVRA